MYDREPGFVRQGTRVCAAGNLDLRYSFVCAVRNPDIRSRVCVAGNLDIYIQSRVCELGNPDIRSRVLCGRKLRYMYIG